MTDLHHLLQDPTKITLKATRDGYGEALVRLGEKDERIVVLTADLSESMKCQAFAQRFPDRFFDCGVAEQNMMGIAAGLALSGKIPFVSSFAVFSPGRNWDQLRVSVAYSQANVKIIGGHTGLATGPDGATHQALEDIAITRVLPGLTVLSPCDTNETAQATIAAARHEGPVYIRLSREPVPILIQKDDPFVIGKAVVLLEGHDVALLTTGPLLYTAIRARAILERFGVFATILHMPSIKPLDISTLVAIAKETQAIVTIEDHQVSGGFGSAVAEALALHCPTPVEFVGVQDRFGESGSAQELYEQYGLTPKAVAAAARKVLMRKRKG